MLDSDETVEPCKTKRCSKVNRQRGKCNSERELSLQSNRFWEKSGVQKKHQINMKIDDLQSKKVKLSEHVVETETIFSKTKEDIIVAEKEKRDLLIDINVAKDKKCSLQQ